MSRRGKVRFQHRKNSNTIHTSQRKIHTPVTGAHTQPAATKTLGPCGHLPRGITQQNSNQKRAGTFHPLQREADLVRPHRSPCRGVRPACAAPYSSRAALKRRRRYGFVSPSYRVCRYPPPALRNRTDSKVSTVKSQHNNKKKNRQQAETTLTRSRQVSTAQALVWSVSCRMIRGESRAMLQNEWKGFSTDSVFQQ